MMKKWLVGTIAGASLFIAGCQQSPEVASTTAGRIRQDEFHERLKNTPAQTGGTYGEQVLQQMIIEDVLEEAYGDQVSDEAVQAELENQAESFGGTEEFENVVAQSGLEMSAFEDSVRLNLLLQEAIKDQVEINEDELREYYENQIPEGTRVAHILVEEEEQAQELIDELNDGADFAELAEEHSMDPGSAANGGEYELVSGQMVPEFEEAAMELEEGEITQEPVETQHGYHIIKMLEKPDKEPFEEVKDQVVDEYINNVLMTDYTVVNEVITNLIQDANVQIADEDLQGAVAAFIETPAVEEPAEEADENSEEQPADENSQEENEESTDEESDSGDQDNQESNEENTDEESDNQETQESEEENTEE